MVFDRHSLHRQFMGLLSMLGYAILVSNKIPVTYLVMIRGKGDTVVYNQGSDMAFRIYLSKSSECT